MRQVRQLPLTGGKDVGAHHVGMLRLSDSSKLVPCGEGPNFTLKGEASLMHGPNLCALQKQAEAKPHPSQQIHVIVKATSPSQRMCNLFIHHQHAHQVHQYHPNHHYCHCHCHEAAILQFLTI